MPISASLTTLLDVADQASPPRKADDPMHHALEIEANQPVAEQSVSTHDDLSHRFPAKAKQSAGSLRFAKTM